MSWDVTVKAFLLIFRKNSSNRSVKSLNMTEDVKTYGRRECVNRLLHLGNDQIFDRATITESLFFCDKKVELEMKR